MQLSALLLAAALIQGSGELQKLDMVYGTGPAAEGGDLVTLHYVGNLLDGTVFDSSIDRTPFNVVLGEGRVIPGWEQGVPGMKVGGRRILSIPPDLAYGEAERGRIPPNSTLVFDIRVLKIYKKGEPQMVEKETIQEGEGQEVKDGDTVEMHYKGMFLDGKQFDSSYDRGQTFSFKVGTGQVIKGFDEAVRGMKPGGKRRATIPPEFGYGTRGAGNVIPPNSTLVFEVELVSVK
jgi:FKBP-type peptidyl-prolyl cis-trans isomerase